LGLKKNLLGTLSRKGSRTRRKNYDRAIGVGLDRMNEHEF